MIIAEKYPTPKDYNGLVEKATPALYEIITKADIDDFDAFYDTADWGYYPNYPEIVLNRYDADVVNTVCVIMIIGRQSLYCHRRKAYKNPDKVFASYANGLWSLNPKERENNIKYISGKIDLIKYLVHGMKLLRIKLEVKTNA